MKILLTLTMLGLTFPLLTASGWTWPTSTRSATRYAASSPS